MKHSKLLLICGLIIILCSCKSTFIPIEEVCKTYEVKIPVESEFPNSSAVMILDNTEWEMKFNENYDLITTQEKHVVKKIFKNLNEHSIIKIPIFRGDDMINLSARTIKPDGRIIPVEKSDIYTIEGVEDGFEFYSDMKYKKFTFPSLEEGCIIEYTYKKYVDFPFLRDIWILKQDIPVKYSEYSLIVPEILMTKGEVTWYYKIYNDNSLGKVKSSKVVQNTITDLDKQVKFNWVKKNTGAFVDEPLMPHGLTEIPHMRFRPGFWKNWNDLSDWYYSKIFKPKFIVSDVINKKAEELTIDINNEEDKIKACYDYVKKLRYVSINLNNGGISPKKPEEVLKNQFGDCKDKSILLLSLLKSLDIKAELVLLVTNNTGYFDKDFPSWNFNHMIVAVKEDENKFLWLDSTADYTDFGKIPAMDQDIDVLVLHADGTSSIVRTQSSYYGDNKKVVDININILENLQNSIDFDLKFFGEDRCAMKYFIEKSSSSEIEEYCKSIIANKFLTSTIKSISYTDSENHEFYNLCFTVDDIDIIKKQGNFYFLEYDFLTYTDKINWLQSKERRYPLQLQYPRTISKNIAITYPNNFLEISTIPENYEKSEKDIINYTQKVNSKSNIIEISKDLSIMNKVIKPYNYSKFRNAFEYVQQKNKEQIIFNKL